MKLRDFRIGWRLLLKEPGYSGAVVLGLAFGFAACFLLLGLVRYSFSYNEQIADSDRTFAVKQRRNLLPRPDWRPDAPAPLVSVATASGLATAATSARSFELTARVGNRFVPLQLQLADANFLDFFGIKPLEGDANGALGRPDALVVSRSMAIKLFGNAQALGKLVHIDGVPFAVRAILPDSPANTSVNADVLLGAGAHSWDPLPARAGAEWFRNAAIYIKAAPGVSAANLASGLQDAATRQFGAMFSAAATRRLNGRPVTDIAITPLSEIYFDDDLLAGRSGERYGSKTSVYGLAALALLILALASANYINLAAVRTLGRQREIGVRKALGVSGGRLAGQFLAESLVVAMAAAVLGLAIAWLALPLFSELVNRPLRAMFSPLACALMLLMGVFTGLLAGIYPALLALRLPASITLQGRGNSETASGMRLRRVLSMLQFGVAIALVAATLAVGWQTRYASHADPGFEPGLLLVLTLPADPKPATAHAFRAELARLPGVQGVAPVSDAIGRDGNRIINMIARPDGTNVPVEAKLVGPSFFGVYGLRPLAGRLFDPAQDRAGATVVVLNARASALGFDSPQAAVGQMLGEYRIVGIAPELRFTTLRQPPGPVLYRIDEEQEVLTVRAPGNVQAVRASIESLWPRHFPNYPPEIESAAGIFAQNYNEDRRLASILALARVVATALASFGIYVLAAYSVKRRAREIVMRKLHGAGGRDIGRLVGREFAVLIGIGALVGLPLAWLGIERYLSGFVERAPMGQWPLACACALVGLVALAATSRQTLAAVRMSPALALRK
jgi:putative ABC transport system permease protein